MRFLAAFRILTASLALVALGDGRAEAQLLPAGPPPFVATPDALVDQMLRLGQVGSEDVVYDLGSGDGRIVVAAAQLGARAVGIEYDAGLIVRSWQRADSAGVRDRVDFRREDLFTVDLSRASVLTLYLSAEFNERLRPTILEQLRPGARVVSHAFHMMEWEPDSTVTIGTGVQRATLFKWIVPADVDGFWFVEVPGQAGMRLELRQTFQRLAGTLRSGEVDHALGAGTVRATAVRFTVDRPRDRGGPMIFEGELVDGRLSGSVRDASGARRWVARRFGANP